MTINESEQKEMTTFVGQSWIDEYNQYYICVELDMEKIKQEKERYQVLFENNPDITSIETPASDPKEISVDTFDKLQIDEIDELIEYGGYELPEHDEWRPRLASLEYRREGTVVYRVGPKHLNIVSTFYIQN